MGFSTKFVTGTTQQSDSFVSTRLRRANPVMCEDGKPQPHLFAQSVVEREEREEQLRVQQRDGAFSDSHHDLV